MAGDAYGLGSELLFAYIETFRLPNSCWNSSVSGSAHLTTACSAQTDHPLVHWGRSVLPTHNGRQGAHHDTLLVTPRKIVPKWISHSVEASMLPLVSHYKNNFFFKQKVLMQHMPGSFPVNAEYL